MYFYFIPFLVVCGLLLIAAIFRPVLIYQYPYFMAATFVAFIAPQLFGLFKLEWAGPFVETTALMSLLCVVCCWLGNLLKPHPTFIEKLNVSLNPDRFLQGGIVLVVTGLYFNYKLSNLPVVEDAGLMSGIGTVYLFFGGLVYPGFAICFYCALKHRNPIAWVATAVAAMIPLQAAIFYGRREPTVLFILSFAMSFYFIKGKTPPRWAVVAAIIGGMFIIPSIGQYRSLAKDDPLAAFKSIDFKEEFGEYFDEEAISEVKNATVLIAVTQQTGDYEWGAGYWNRIVFRFVPAQFVGREFKNSLMIGGALRDPAEFVEENMGYALPTGSTVTGLGDSFNQFGYFGCLVFAVMAYIFKNFWTAANHADGTGAQILYIQVMTTAMRSLTHQTLDFLPGLIYSGLFIGLVVYYAKERRDWSRELEHERAIRGKVETLKR